MRISNFLLWQIAYAELYVTETLWPDFNRADLLEAVLEYQKRDRRYGGLSAPQRRDDASGRVSHAAGPSRIMKRVLTAAALVPPVLATVFFANDWLFFAVVAAGSVHLLPRVRFHRRRLRFRRARADRLWRRLAAVVVGRGCVAGRARRRANRLCDVPPHGRYGARAAAVRAAGDGHCLHLRRMEVRHSFSIV